MKETYAKDCNASTEDNAISMIKQERQNAFVHIHSMEKIANHVSHIFRIDHSFSQLILR